MLHLLLAVQLPAPVGLSKAALYLSTESSLPTGRVTQLLAEHPTLKRYTAQAHPKTGTGTWPSLDNIYTQEINTLDVQERVMEQWVPLLIERRNIGLIIIDSLTGNYREEFSNPEYSFKQNMIRRAKAMRKMGVLLREYARAGVAVVVVNQVSDRFRKDGLAMSGTPRPFALSSTQHVSSEAPKANTTRAIMASRLAQTEPTQAPSNIMFDDDRAMKVAVQEQYFSGWGDDPLDQENLKNPWGGIAWTKQLSCRIVLIKKLDRVTNDGSFRRWAKVVFCPWAASSGPGVRSGAVEYRITTSGLQGIETDLSQPLTPPPVNPHDPYGMEDPAVVAEFEELEKDWPLSHPAMLAQEKADTDPLQIGTMKMQEPIIMAQAPIAVHATHITFDEDGENVARQELVAPRLNPTSEIGSWDRRTGTASQPVAPRRIFRDEITNTQIEDQDMSDFQDVPGDAYAPPQQEVASGGAAPDSDPESSDNDDDVQMNNDLKRAVEASQPKIRRFGSEVPDSEAESEAESEDESDGELFVEKNTPERQWEADHGVEEATGIQIADDLDPEDNFLHPQTEQELKARQAEKEKQDEEQSRMSPVPAPKPFDIISAKPVSASTKAALTRNLKEKAKSAAPQPIFAADHESANPHATKISGWVSADGQRIVEPSTGDHAVNPPDDAFVPSRPYGEAICASEEIASTMDEMASLPADTQPDESASKKERRAAKRARKAEKKARKEEKKSRQFWRKYPWSPSAEEHTTAMAAEKDEVAKARLLADYQLMCENRAREQGITIFEGDWPLGQTAGGDYLDIQNGFYVPTESAEHVLTQSRLAAEYIQEMREMGEDVEEWLNQNSHWRPTSSAQKMPAQRQHEGSIPPSQLSSKSDLPNVIYPSVQPRESMMPESPSKGRKETPILPPKTHQQKQAERKKQPPILPGAKPPTQPSQSSQPPSTPVRPRSEAGSSPQSSGRKETRIVPGSKPSSPSAATPAPAPVETPVRKVTPVYPPKSPVAVIPDVPSMKRMKKRLPGSQLRNVMNSSDAVSSQPELVGRQKSKSMEPLPALDQENLPRSSAPRSSPPLSVGPPATPASKVQALSPTKARARYSPNQRKRSGLQETYNHSLNPDNVPSPASHHPSEYEDISQESQEGTTVVEERPKDPPILPGMKPTKPLPVYKHPKHSHKKKPPVTPVTPLRPDQLPKEDDIDYDAMFPSQASQESPVKEKQVFITKQGVKYPASKPGKDFYGASKITKEVVYPPTKGQRDAAELERTAAVTPTILKDVAYPPTRGQRDAAEAEQLAARQSSTQKKKVVFNFPPTKALDVENMDPEDDGEGMAGIINFTALGTPTRKTQQQKSQGGFLPLTSSPPKPYPSAQRQRYETPVPKSAPAKTFHATSISNATINALTVSRQPKYSSKPSARWQEAQKELGITPTVQVPSSQPEVDDEHMHEDEVEIDGDGDIMESASRPPPLQAPNGTEEVTVAEGFEMTASDDEYGFDAGVLEAMTEVVVPPASALPASQKRPRQESPAKAGHHRVGLSALKRARQESPVKDIDPAPHSSPVKRARLSNPGETNLGMSPCAQRRTSSESNISIPSTSREKTSKLFDKVKTLKAQGLPMNYPAPPTSSQYEPGYTDGDGNYHPPESQFGGPSRAFRELQATLRTSSSAGVGIGITTQDRDGSRTWIPDAKDMEEPHPSIERDELGRDEEDVVWEDNALKEQAEREIREREEREEREILKEKDRDESERMEEVNGNKGRVDPRWLYENQ